MEQELRKRIALNIKIERLKKNFTQEKLAELTEISVKHITKIENAKVTPSILLIYKIAKSLEVTIDTLTDREV